MSSSQRWNERSSRNRQFKNPRPPTRRPTRAPRGVVGTLTTNSPSESLPGGPSLGRGRGTVLKTQTVGLEDADFRPRDGAEISAANGVFKDAAIEMAESSSNEDALYDAIDELRSVSKNVSVDEVDELGDALLDMRIARRS